MESGPRVLCGHQRGQVGPGDAGSQLSSLAKWLHQVSTIMLPSFEFKTAFQALPGPASSRDLFVNFDRSWMFPHGRPENRQLALCWA